MEAGFPAASPDDLESRAAASRTESRHRGRAGQSPAWPAPTQGDIDKAWEAVEPAAKPRIHTFLATSDLHLEHKLQA